MAINEIHHFEDTTANIATNKWSSMLAFDTTLDHLVYVKADGATFRHVITADSTNTIIQSLGSVTMQDDKFIGLGASKGRIEFDDTPAVDEVNILNARVGIGTSSPSALFQIEETNASFIFDGSPSTSGYNTTFIMDDTGLKIGTDSPIRGFRLQTNSIERLTILAGGDVGIGIAAPLAQLHVLATTEQLRLAFDASNYLSITVGSDSTSTFGVTGAGNKFVFTTLNTGTYEITQTAQATGINHNIDFFSGSLRIGRIQTQVDDLTGSSEDSSIHISALNAGSLNTVILIKERNVSIGGTVTPSAKLDVAGDIAIADGITAPGATAGRAKLYVDTADGDFKIIFGDGTIKTIAVDT